MCLLVSVFVCVCGYMYLCVCDVCVYLCVVLTEDKPPPRPLARVRFKGGGQLRDYQTLGYTWLLWCWANDRGCILVSPYLSSP